MPRPKTKQELINQSNTNFEKMWELINSLPEAKRYDNFNLEGKEAHWKRDKNIRDILIHLYEWHQLLLKWVKSNQSNNNKPFLPEPYNWKTYGDMNIEFWKKHKNTSDEDAIKMLKKSHNDVMSLINDFSNNELFQKAHFTWTDTTSLGSYFISTTSSHYDWAIKKLKKL